MKVELIENPRKDFKPITIQLTLETEQELAVCKFGLFRPSNWSHNERVESFVTPVYEKLVRI